MQSMNDFNKAVKQIAMKAFEEADPTSLVYGTVEEADEETGEVAAIRLDQQWVADADQTVIPHTYQERVIEKVKIKGECISKLREVLGKLEIEWEPEEECESDEALVDVTIKDFLKAGEKVAMIRKQGGQQLIVLGRTAINE